MLKIAIIDYGMGNLRSVENAVNRLNFDCKIVSIPKELNNYDKIIFPGVGSFKKAMKLLNEKSWINSIKENVLEKNKHILGICLGMQLLRTKLSSGLDLIKGKIKYLGNLGCKKKIPQIGWNSISIKKKHIYLNKIPDGMDFYFVNSYVFVPEDNSYVVASTNYDVDFCSIIAKNNIFGTQFHPEKSSKAGMKILQNFLDA